jgi:hypothetical protein
MGTRAGFDAVVRPVQAASCPFHEGGVLVGNLLSFIQIDAKEIHKICLVIRECIQKFPDWPPGVRTANGRALCQ